MKPTLEQRIPQLVQQACILEVCAPKPGNVNRFHDFCDTSLEDYLLSAAALAAAFERVDLTGVGQLVLNAAARTRQYVRSNTNLGIILLFAPLLKACLSAERENDDIRRVLVSILKGLSVEDARLTYAAIRLMQPGGMGKAPQEDVSEEPSITLLQAMEMAKDRDSIALEYVTGFAITFEKGLPSFRDAYARSGKYSDAIVQTFLAILSEVPDTLIIRKKGMDQAQQVSRLAADVLAKGGVFTPEGNALLAEMDTTLRDKAHLMNPGTTADLTAAAVFLALLENPL